MAKPKDVITQIQKATRRKFTADEKIRIVLEGLRGEASIIDRFVQLLINAISQTCDQR